MAIADNLIKNLSNIVGFPNYNKKIHTINEAGSTWKATENCWAICSIFNDHATYAANVSINNVAVAQAMAGKTQTITMLPIAKGQTIRTRADVGTYTISIYECYK